MTAFEFNTSYERYTALQVLQTLGVPLTPEQLAREYRSPHSFYRQLVSAYVTAKLSLQSTLEQLNAARGTYEAARQQLRIRVARDPHPLEADLEQSEKLTYETARMETHYDEILDTALKAEALQTHFHQIVALEKSQLTEWEALQMKQAEEIYLLLQTYHLTPSESLKTELARALSGFHVPQAEPSAASDFFKEKHDPKTMAVLQVLFQSLMTTGHSPEEAMEKIKSISATNDFSQLLSRHQNSDRDLISRHHQDLNELVQQARLYRREYLTPAVEKISKMAARLQYIQTHYYPVQSEIHTPSQEQVPTFQTMAKPQR